MVPQALNEQLIGEAQRIFASLGDASRLRILRALLDAGSPLSQGALAEATGLSQPNASKHLSHLLSVGLVTRERQGNTVMFAAVTPVVPVVCEVISRHVTQRVTQVYESLQ
ncbi:MAG: winged helix-turn-helix transcriptional regulator [Acidobacteria bacterium]|nr:winged helix-turn-helix transcriptional regulator [Acidobacteriota bacterium]